jgi:quercetin dioxygenase-like cupin family protein
MGRKERPVPKEKEEDKMITAKPNELELLKFWQESDPATGIRINFPVDAQTGAASSAAVYFEVESEQHIGRHTHSAEEILFVLEGEAEAVVGDERGRLSKEEMAVVPANAPHDLYNVGEATLRVVGFFSSAAVVTIFDDPLAPLNTKVPPVAGAPLPVA